MYEEPFPRIKGMYKEQFPKVGAIKPFDTVILKGADGPRMVAAYVNHSIDDKGKEIGTIGSVECWWISGHTLAKEEIPACLLEVIADQPNEVSYRGVTGLGSI